MEVVAATYICVFRCLVYDGILSGAVEPGTADLMIDSCKNSLTRIENRFFKKVVPPQQAGPLYSGYSVLFDEFHIVFRGISKAFFAENLIHTVTDFLRGNDFAVLCET